MLLDIRYLYRKDVDHSYVGNYIDRGFKLRTYINCRIYFRFLFCRTITIQRLGLYSIQFNPAMQNLLYLLFVH